MLLILLPISHSTTWAGSITTPSGLTGNNWMSYLPDTANLAELNIPGSHDSATFNLEYIGTWWLRTQSESIYYQLCDGGRLLDLRLVAKEDDELYAAHGPAVCYDEDGNKYYYYNVIKEIKWFLSEHPTETVIVVCQKEDEEKSGLYDTRINEIMDAARLSDQYIVLDANSQIPSLGEARGKIVLFKSGYYTKYEDHDTVGAKKKCEWIDEIWKSKVVDSDYEKIDYLQKTQDYEDNKTANAPRPMVIYTSVREGGTGWPMTTIAEMVDFLSKYDYKQGRLYGWQFHNFLGVTQAKATYSTNNFYYNPHNFYWGYKDNILYLSTVESDYTPSELVDKCYSDKASIPWSKYSAQIESVKVVGMNKVAPHFTDNWFNGCYNLIHVDCDMIDTSHTVSMNSMFYGCDSLESLDIRTWNLSSTSTLAQAKCMFRGCSNLEVIYAAADADLSSKQQGRFKGMFDGCYALTGGVGSTVRTADKTDNTVARIDSITNHGYFSESYSIYWKITEADGKKTLHLAGDNSDETYTEYIVNLATAADDIPWHTHATEINAVVTDSEIMPTYTAYWFADCSAVTDYNLEKLNTERTIDMSYMFTNNSALTYLRITSFRNVKVARAVGMFENCTNLEHIKTAPTYQLRYLGGNGANMFVNSTKLHNWKHARADSSSNAHTDSYDGIFEGDNLFWGISGDGKVFYISSDKNDSRTPNVGDTFATFGTYEFPNWQISGALTDAQKAAIEKVEVIGEFMVSGTPRWFWGFKNCTEFDLTGLDASECANMKHMFDGCESVETIDISNFGSKLVVSRKESGSSGYKSSYDYVFRNCKKLKTIYVSDSFDLSTGTGANVFAGCDMLQGGNGTSYATYGDKTAYACPDGLNGKKGYFTNVSSDMYWGYDGSTKTLYLGSGNTTDTPNAFDSKIEYSEDLIPWAEFRNDVEKVQVLDIIAPINTTNWFYMMGQLADVNLSLMDTTKTKSMAGMFKRCGALWQLDIVNFRSDSLEDVSGMFWYCRQIRKIIVDYDFDLSKIYGTAGANTFLRCDFLKGSNGTTYNSNKYDSSVGIVDGKGGKPGLFTAVSLADSILALDYEGVYDGEEHGISIIPMEKAYGIAVMYSISEGGRYSPTPIKTKDVGTMTVYYRAELPGYAPVYGHKQIKITPKDFDDRSIRVYGSDGEYDGMPHSPQYVLTEDAMGATVEFSLDEDGTYSTTPPECTDAGSYTVYYKVSKEGYNTKTGSVSFVISPASIGTCDINPEQIRFVYDETTPGRIYSPSITVSRNGTPLNQDVDYIFDGDIQSDTPGMYIIKVCGDGNYFGEIPVVWVIYEKDYPDITANSYKNVYDGSSHSVEFIMPGNLAPGYSVKMYYGTNPDNPDDLSETNPEFTDVGEYVVMYKGVVVDDSGEPDPGYAECRGSATVNIMPVGITDENIVITPHDESGKTVLVYNGEEQHVSYDVSVQLGANQYVLTKAADATSAGDYYPVLEETSATDIGIYGIAIKAKGNFTGNANATYYMQVGKLAEGDVAVTSYAGEYDGRPHSISVALKNSASDAKVMYRYSADSEYVSGLQSYVKPGNYTIGVWVGKDGYEPVELKGTVTIHEPPKKDEPDPIDPDPVRPIVTKAVATEQTITNRIVATKPKKLNAKAAPVETSSEETDSESEISLEEPTTEEYSEIYIDLDDPEEPVAETSGNSVWLIVAICAGVVIVGSAVYLLVRRRREHGKRD